MDIRLGLTFDEAIRALQSALAPPRGAVPDFRPADDVLARARERVQSRAAPTLRDIMKDLPRPVAPPPLQQQWPPPPMEAPVAEPFPVTEVPSVQLGAPAEQPVEVQLRPSVEPEAAPEPVAR